MSLASGGDGGGCDLVGIINALSVGDGVSGCSGSEEICQVLHPNGRGPYEGASLACRTARFANDIVTAVDAASSACDIPRQGTEALHTCR